MRHVISRLQLRASLSDYRQYRLLEMLPGVLVWTTFALAVLLSFIQPFWAIVFILLFDFLWLVRVLYWVVYLVVAYVQLKRALRVNWQERLASLPHWRRLYHVVFLPFANEPLDVMRSTMTAIAASVYPKDRLLVVLATEERMGAAAQEKAGALEREFGGVFFRFLRTVHPAHLPGEVIGKGSNIHWAGRKFQELVDTTLHIPYEDIIVTSFDVDTQPHPQYFSYLSYLYGTHPNPTRTSFQPVPLFNNNVWHSPALMRVAAMSTTFWLMTEQMRPDRLFTFSSHSMSFRALVDVGFWQNDIVTEDSRIFLQCFLRYDGDYTVTPMYLPVSMDTVASRTFWRSLRNLYKQQQRWAYGVENFPYMAWNFRRNPLIPFHTKLRYMWNQLEGVYSWATAPIIMFVMGRLPLVVAGDRLGNSILAHNAPFIIQQFMTLALVGVFTCAALSVTLLPPLPPQMGKWRFVLVLLQWIFLPLTLIVFGSIPATDAQTRLMLGRYLGFHVTEKTR